MRRRGFTPFALRRARSDDLIRTGLLFFIPFSQFITLNVVGQLALSDILVLLLAPYFLIRNGLGGGFESRTVYVGIGLWALGAVVSDIYSATAFSDLSRGWMRIATLFSYIYVFTSLIGNRIGLIAYWGIGYGLGGLVTVLVSRDEMFLTNPYKFGLGIALINLVLAGFPLLFPRLQASATVRALLLLALGGLSLYNDARSLFAFCIVAGVLAFLVTTVQTRFPGRVSMLGTIACLIGALLAMSGAKAVYTSAVENGVLGEAMYQKYKDQTSGDANLLLAGRPELYASLQAIADSPIIGRGSWARDPYYVRLKIVRLESAGVRTYAEDFDIDQIPSHSAILNSWIEAGILGVPLWITILVFVIRFLLNITRVRTILLGMILFNVIDFCWDVFFSPITVSTRLLGPLAIVVVCKVLEMLREERTRAALGPGSARLA